MIDWDRFFAENWRRAPTVLRQPFDTPMPSPEAAFDAVVAASNDFRERSDYPRMRVNIDGGFLMVDMDERLPTAEDRHFEQYVDRLAPWRGARPFVMTLNDYQSWDGDFWSNAKSFLTPLFQRAGLPAGPMLANLWVGRYAFTPFGIHSDHAETFLYLVHGKKRMLVWPHEVFAGRRVYHTPGGDHLGTTDYQPYLDQAIVLEAEPGDLIYWPATYWHLAESNRQATVSLNWAYLTAERPRTQPLEMALAPLRAAAVERMEDALAIEAYPLGDGVPELIDRSADALIETARVPQYRRSVHAQWLAHQTNFAMGRPPPLRRRVALDEGDRLRADPPPILVEQFEPWFLAGAGHTFDVNTDPKLREVIARLGAGATVGELEALLPDWSRLDARLFLERLVRHRIADVV